MALANRTMSEANNILYDKYATFALKDDFCQIILVVKKCEPPVKPSHACLKIKADFVFIMEFMT